MTDYVTKDGRHVSIDHQIETLPAPATELLRDLYREDVDDATWDQWDYPEETDVHPYKRGHRGTLVFHRKVDNTYWAADFISQNEGDFHSLRDDGGTHVYRVWPVQVTTTKYVDKDPNA